MSYCRFSSDNFMCDVYVYEDVYGGWTTHVAGNRYALPPLPSLPIMWTRVFGGEYDSATRTVKYPTKLCGCLASGYFWLYSRWESLRNFTLDRMPRRHITLPHAGQRFNDDTPGECADRLQSLKDLGYNVPDRAIDALRKEQNDLAPCPIS